MEIEAKPFAVLPRKLRQPQEVWLGPDGETLDSFLEGPAFDRDGNLYVVDILGGQILQVSTTGVFSRFLNYGGRPNGLKFSNSGDLWVADRKHGLLLIDRDTQSIETLHHGHAGRPFLGLNDLFLDRDGAAYFTDQGESDLLTPNGSVYRRSSGGELVALLNAIPSPNGVVLAPDGRSLLIAVTRSNCIWRSPLRPDGALGRTGLFIQLSGGTAGPDGIAFDRFGRLLVAHAGLGTVWLLDRVGRPLGKIVTDVGLLTTNIVLGGADGLTVYITESQTGTILTARLQPPE